MPWAVATAEPRFCLSLVLGLQDRRVAQERKQAGSDSLKVPEPDQASLFLYQEEGRPRRAPMVHPVPITLVAREATV